MGPIKPVALLAAVVAAALVTAPAAKAQADYPNRPVRIIIGFGAGSAADLSARIVGARLGQLLGQQFVVEVRTGGGSNIAAEFVARAPKDGYTLLMANSANAVTAGLGTFPSLDFIKDLQPVVPVSSVPTLVVAHPSLGAKNLKELIAVAKAKPGQIFYGSPGVGTASHLGGELINQKAGISMTHVPYTGSPQVLTDLLAGRIQLSLGAASTALPHLRAGTLVGIGMAQAQRASAAPEVPTLAEQGVAGIDAGLWFGLMAPAGTPRPVVDRLAKGVNEALKTEEVVAALRKAGFDAIGGSPEEFTRQVADDVARWHGVAKAAGLAKK